MAPEENIHSRCGFAPPSNFEGRSELIRVPSASVSSVLFVPATTPSPLSSAARPFSPGAFSAGRTKELRWLDGGDAPPARLDIGGRRPYASPTRLPAVTLAAGLVWTLLPLPLPVASRQSSRGDALTAPRGGARPWRSFKRCR